MLNFISATLIGLGLLAPVERMLGRLGGAALALLAVAGAGPAATAYPSRFSACSSCCASLCVDRSPVVRAKLCCHVRCRE